VGFRGRYLRIVCKISFTLLEDFRAFRGFHKEMGKGKDDLVDRETKLA